MLRISSFWSCCWCHPGDIFYGYVHEKVFGLLARTYLFALNLLNLVVTGALQTGDVATLYIFRICQGILVGNFMTLIPSYISELTPKEMGSRYGVYPQISVVLGVLASFTLGMIFTDSFRITSSTTL